MLGGERAKRCNRCETVKLVTEFYVRRGRGDGYQAQCKECDKAWVLEYRAANPERWRRYYRESSRRVVRDPERGPIRRAYEREHMRRVRGTKPENFKHEAGVALSVPASAVREAVEASELSLSAVARRVGRDPSGLKRSLARPEMDAVLARDVLAAVDLTPVEVGL